MANAFAIGVSGLQAAAHSVAVSASNIVNARSGGPIGSGTAVGGGTPYSGYQPLEPVSSSVPQGGVVSGTRPVTPAFVPAPGDDGQGLPNVSLVADVVRLKTAETAYKASASLIRTADDMQKTLLSVKG